MREKEIEIGDKKKEEREGDGGWIQVYLSFPPSLLMSIITFYYDINKPSTMTSIIPLL